MLAVWALWVLDPVSRLGDRFYLGELFRYDGPGFWFGLPAGSQLGFAAHRRDPPAACCTASTATAPNVEVPRACVGHPHLVALITYHAQVFHLAAVAFWLGEDTVGGAAVLAVGAPGRHHRRALEPAPAPPAGRSRRDRRHAGSRPQRRLNAP